MSYLPPIPFIICDIDLTLDEEEWLEDDEEEWDEDDEEEWDEEE